VFRPPQPFPSWTWQEAPAVAATAGFFPPVPYPEDGEMYDWDEENQTWNPS
jgi:hypothetical protein